MDNNKISNKIAEKAKEVADQVAAALPARNNERLKTNQVITKCHRATATCLNTIFVFTG